MSSLSLFLALPHRPHSLCPNLPTIILLLAVLLGLPFPSPATPEWTYRFLFPSLLPDVRPGQRSRLLLLLAMITCVDWRGNWEDLQLWEEKAEFCEPGRLVSGHVLPFKGDQHPPAGHHHWTFGHATTWSFEQTVFRNPFASLHPTPIGGSSESEARAYCAGAEVPFPTPQA